MKTRKPSSPENTTLVEGRSQKENSTSRRVYPFCAIVGQEEMKLALVLNVIDPLIGGVLIMGHRGTGKSTAVRGLADLLPEMSVVRDCLYRCDPEDRENRCQECAAKLSANAKLQRERVPVRVVELPLGATEDRVCGTIDIERALQAGKKAFEPGLLARANRGFLYIDEVNLLEDHLIDLLLDAAATGRNRVERETISVEHPARFVLIGSGNPEEGELRPQLQDRFGLHVEVTTDHSLDSRVAVVEKREAFERDPDAFFETTRADQDFLRRRIEHARKKLAKIRIDRALIRQVAQLCSDLKIDGHRGELTITRAARVLAAFEGRSRVTAEDVKRVTVMSLRHRVRRDALDDTASTEQIRQALDRVFSSSPVAGKGTGDYDFSPADQSRGKNGSIERPVNSRAGKAPHAKSISPQGKNGSDGISRLSEPADSAARIKALTTRGSQSAISGVRSVDSLSGRQGSQKASMNRNRGRYIRAVGYKTARVAVDATLRASASDKHDSTGQCNPAVANGSRDADATKSHSKALTRIRQSIRSDALRYKLFARKSGSLFIFAIDTSGSMALNRINQAKGALLQLLKKSYIDRDRVAIVAFGGTQAKVYLPPSRSMLRARRVLDTLSVGGGTPLPAGLACSLKVAKQMRAQVTLNTVLLVFTDGRANVPLRANGMADRANQKQLIEGEIRFLGSELGKAGVATVVVETRNSFFSGGEARELAEMLAAQLVQISSPPIEESNS